jgi:Na+/melibiose symporter-like transporter
MNTSELTSWLAFGTLGVALIIAIILWLRFMRKPGNRHPMRGERERNINDR